MMVVLDLSVIGTEFTLEIDRKQTHNLFKVYFRFVFMRQSIQNFNQFDYNSMIVLSLTAIEHVVGPCNATYFFYSLSFDNSK